MKLENLVRASDAGDAEIKLIDFGLSKYCANKLAENMVTKVGTSYYVAPQVLERSYTDKCDIWSCGVVAYLLMCGYPPFWGDTDAQILVKVTKGDFDYPSEEWQDSSSNVKEFIGSMLTLSENVRPNAKQMLSHQWLKEGTLPILLPKVGSGFRTNISEKPVSSSGNMNDQMTKRWFDASPAIAMTLVLFCACCVVGLILYARDTDKDKELMAAKQVPDDIFTILRGLPFNPATVMRVKPTLTSMFFR